MEALSKARASAYIIGVFILPVVISACFKLANSGSIGPIVFWYSLLSFPVLAFQFFFIFGERLDGRVVVLLSVVSGLVFSVLLLNFFMWVTWLFGVNDYQAM
jgi:hypothetical protein